MVLCVGGVKFFALALWVAECVHVDLICVRLSVGKMHLGKVSFFFDGSGQCMVTCSSFPNADFIRKYN